MVRAADCVPVLFRATRGRRRRRRALRPSRPARRHRAAHRRDAARAGRGHRSRAWVGPHVCGALLRGARRDAGRGRGRRTGEPGDHVVGDAVPRPRGRGARPARGATVSPSSTCPAAPASPPTSTPTVATAPGPGGTPGWSGCGPTERPAATSCAAGLAPVEARIAAACADAGRDPARRPPRRRDQDVPGLGRAPARRARGHRRRREQAAGARPPSAPSWRRACRSAGTSSGTCRATRPPRSPRYADVVHSVDRAKLVGAAATGRGSGPVDVLLQVSLDPPGADRPLRGRPRRPRRAGRRRSTASEHLSLRGLMAVAPLGEDPAEAFARLAEIRARIPRGVPRGRPGSPRA